MNTWSSGIGLYIHYVNSAGSQCRHNEAVPFLIRISMTAGRKQTLNARVWFLPVLPCSTRYCSVLICTALHCTALYCTHNIVLYCTAALSCNALHCTALHCAALYCTDLYCTLLHCTALHCTALQHSTITDFVRSFIRSSS